MLFPFLDGFVNLLKAKMTWTLFFINSAVLFMTFGLSDLSQNDLESKLRDNYFRDSQGRFYAQFIEARSQSYSPMLNEISKRALEGDYEKVTLLGNLAIRDERFVREAPLENFKGDKVALQVWRKTFLDVLSIQEFHPSYALGLKASDLRFDKWISYIFVHSGFGHFAGNMIFLLIFGCALEPLIGSLALLIVFLASGVLAAGSFILMTGATAAPLVGASGAVSGLMSLFACLYWKRSVRFLYWLYLPIRGFAGYIFLPAWVILAMWLLSDLTGYIGTLNEFGGVAYTAHLGGEITGILVGLIVFALRYRKKPYIHPNQANPPMGEIRPFQKRLSSA